MWGSLEVIPISLKVCTLVAVGSPMGMGLWIYTALCGECLGISFGYESAFCHIAQSLVL